MRGPEKKRPLLYLVDGSGSDMSVDSEYNFGGGSGFYIESCRSRIEFELNSTENRNETESERGDENENGK